MFSTNNPIAQQKLICRVFDSTYPKRLLMDNNGSSFRFYSRSSFKLLNLDYHTANYSESKLNLILNVYYILKSEYIPKYISPASSKDDWFFSNRKYPLQDHPFWQKFTMSKIWFKTSLFMEIFLLSITACTYRTRVKFLKNIYHIWLINLMGDLHNLDLKYLNIRLTKPSCWNTALTTTLILINQYRICYTQKKKTSVPVNSQIKNI